MASRIHRRKPRGRPTGERTAKANGRKSAVRAKAGARLRPPEEPHGTEDPHGRHRPRPRRRSRSRTWLQHEPPVPAPQSDCVRLSPPGPEQARVPLSDTPNRPKRPEPDNPGLHPAGPGANPVRQPSKPTKSRNQAVVGVSSLGILQFDTWRETSPYLGRTSSVPRGRGSSGVSGLALPGAGIAAAGGFLCGPLAVP